tara:strand:+ start:147 stop:920 length:774 start_codon:yes stop_codon:yes gene_type:complete
MKIFTKKWFNLTEIRWIGFIVKKVNHLLIGHKNKEYKNMLLMDSNKERFSEIYRKNFWSSSESGSGKGSELKYTKSIRDWLIKICPKYNVKSFLDVACGDFNWMRFVVSHLDIEYTGMDIVDDVIDQNIAQYADSKISFVTADICNDPLPDCDLLMIRDCLFHLSFSDIDDFFLNLSKTNYKFLVTTTHILSDTYVNHDVISGDFRNIDLFKPPFNFQEKDIAERCNDYISGFTPREMILVAKENVPNFLKGEILNA